MIGQGARSRLAAAAAFLVAAATPVASQTFSKFVGFGDSTIDSGAYRTLDSPGGGPSFNALWPSAVAAGAGKPTTSPGLMSSEALAASFRLTAVPANQGGSNYATSGAKNATLNDAATGGFKAATPTITQIANYLAANGGNADGNALYLISSGGNDVSYALGKSGVDPPSDPIAYIKTAANSLAGAIAGLQAAGARTIVVRNVAFSFPMGSDPEKAAIRQARLSYCQALWSALRVARVEFIPANYDAVRRAIAANPASYGLQSADTTKVACTQPDGVTSAWGLLCSASPQAPSHLVSPSADQIYLFADDQHLTTKGQKIVADYEHKLVVNRGKTHVEAICR